MKTFQTIQAGDRVTTKFHGEGLATGNTVAAALTSEVVVRIEVILDEYDPVLKTTTLWFYENEIVSIA